MGSFRTFQPKIIMSNLPKVFFLKGGSVQNRGPSFRCSPNKNDIFEGHVIKSSEPAFIGIFILKGYVGIGQSVKWLRIKAEGIWRRSKKKAARAVEWGGVVRREAGFRGLARVAVEIGRAALSWSREGSVSQVVWRKRIRACMTCPVFDRSRHACRDRRGLNLGCGCWMPAKAKMSGNQCWRKKLDGGGHSE